MAALTRLIDEPGRVIEMLESVVPVVTDQGLRLNEYKYYARRNGGEWLALQSLGNRIPADW